MKRKALGKGLDSLIPRPPRPVPGPPVSAPPTEATETQIDIDRIRPNPRQPRQEFDEESLEALAQSLVTEGILQPVVVRRAAGGEYELIAGERRWRAAQRAGILKIPAVVREVPDERLLEVALIENLQREELNAIEEARAYRTLVEEMGLNQQEVADRVGKRRATIANSLRLLTLPEHVQNLVRSGAISMGHARALAALDPASAQIAMADRIVRDGLSVRQVEAAVARAGRAGGRPPARGKPERRDPNVVAAEEKLQSALGTRVSIRTTGRGGKIELLFHSSEEMERIYGILLEAAKRRR